MGRSHGHKSKSAQESSPSTLQRDHNRSNRRRNTVDSSAPGATAAPCWPPALSPYTPHPNLFPLYGPLLQFAQLHNLNPQSIFLPQAYTPRVPYTPVYSTPSASRPRSPSTDDRRSSQPEEASGVLDGKPNDTNNNRSGRGSMKKSERVGSMPPKDDGLHQPLAHRPSFNANDSFQSQHSNSLPSTPHQRGRQLSLNSRSPSPNGVTTHSPRSVRSESNSMLPHLRNPPTSCKFETGMAFSRRRMPYSIGDAPLEDPPSEPKPSLDQTEAEKLSGDMRELYDRLLPSEESEERRTKFVQKLEKILNDEWPGNQIKVNVFGSSGNMLCTSESDVDICITTTFKGLENMCTLARVLSQHGMERIVCVPHAKVPIVRSWDPALQLACDINVNNTLALENTRMIKTYVEIDERVRPLAMIIKHWTKRRVLNDAALGGTLSSYTWICMIINFLQMRHPPVLPVLHQRPHQMRTIAGVKSSFADDLETLRGYGKDNTESLGDLLFHFFRRYAHELDYSKDVLSVRFGSLLSKEEKGWHLLQNNRLCVEEPFNTNRNLGNTADDTSFRGLHLELRRAFDILAEGKGLSECCEEYVFPAEEERFWEKPPPQPRPILSRSSSQTRRGGRGGPSNSRRTSNNFNPKGNRRSSSGASFGNGIYPNLNPGLALEEYYLQTQQAHNQLRDQLIHQYQLLQHQENELRFQLLQQAQAQALAQAQAQVQASSQMQGRNQSRPPNISLSTSTPNTRPGYLDNAPLTAPIPQEGFYYPPPFSMISSPISSQPTERSTASPRPTPVLPEPRRSISRSATEGSSSGFRSHSQPARRISSAMPYTTTSASIAAHNAIIEYYRLQQGRQLGPTNGAIDPAFAQASLPRVEGPVDDNSRKEYVGYYVGDSPSGHQIRPDYTLSPVPTFEDLSNRRMRGSPEQGSRLSLDPGMRYHRSPSPLRHTRSLSTGIGSNPMGQGVSNATNGLGIHDPSAQHRGPVIIDGSGPAVLEPQPIQPSMSESTSTSDDAMWDTPATMSDTQSQGHPDFIGDPQSQPLYAQNLFEIHNKAETTPRNTTTVLLSAQNGSRSSPPSTSPHIGTSSSSTRLNTVGEEETESSPRQSPNIRQRASRRINLLPAGSVPALDIGKATNSASIEDKSAIAPVLSPVLETRTPSPTTNRKFEHVAEAKLNGTAPPSRLVNGDHMQPPPTPASGAGAPQLSGAAKVNGHVKKASMNAVASNGWQQPAKKGNRKRAKSNPSQKATGTGSPKGEPLPANESDRKGG